VFWSESNFVGFLKLLSTCKNMGKQEDLQMVSTNPETRRNRSLTTGRHTIGGALPPEAITAHAQDDLEEWFPLGLTCTLVVRKHSGLSRRVWHAYQDRSINALVYHSQRTASSRLKFYTNIKLQDATPRIEDSINIHEGSDNPNTAKATREASSELKTFQLSKNLFEHTR
jgi:hypothetical protein